MAIPLIKFVYDRKKLASKGVKGNIDMRITHGRTQKYISTGIKILPSQWDEARECVTGSFDAMTYNEMLSKMRTNALKAINKMMDEDVFDINAITDMLRQKKIEKTFLEYVHERIGKKQVADVTRKSYQTFYARFFEWGGIKNFADISEKNIKAWDEYLHNVTWTEKDHYGHKTTRQYTRASIGSMHKNLKVFINDALIDGYIKENPYSAKRIRIDKGEKRIDKYLTPEEVDLIANATMPTSSLAEARDIFIFQCLTGMSYIDVFSFDKKKMFSESGMMMYADRRHKTLTEFVTVIPKLALGILEKYDFTLPLPPNQKYNIKLKLVADAAGIDKPLSSHWARHTAGTIWINNGVPVEIVSKCLGHTNTTITLSTYSKLQAKTIAKAFKRK